MNAIATVPIYLRIPIELRKKLEEVSKSVGGYRPRGALADTVIKALESGLKSIATEKSDQLDLFKPKPLRKHARGRTKPAQRPRPLKRHRKHNRRGRK